MNVRRINLTLWTTTATLAAGAIVCAALGVLTPVDVHPDSTGVTRRAPATSQASPDAQLPVAAFEPIWALNLHNPLTDAGPDTATTQADTNPGVPTTSGPFVLVGTIGDSLALIRTAAGVIEVKGIGDQINGAKIVAIRPLQVDIELGGARTTVAKAREGSGG